MVLDPRVSLSENNVPDFLNLVSLGIDFLNHIISFLSGFWPTPPITCMTLLIVSMVFGVL